VGTEGKAGRPLLLDDLKAKRICDAIEAGNTFRVAALSAGINLRTLEKWRAQGRAGIPPFDAFLRKFEEAQTKAHKRAVETVTVAMKLGDVRAAQWWLERRAPNEWGSLDRERRGKPVEDLSDEELHARLSKALEQLKTEKTG
jgi:hypothetical protein